MSLWRESDRTLILGDVLNNQDPLLGIPGLRLPKDFFTPDPARNRQSAKRLGELEPLLVLFGHGAARARHAQVRGLLREALARRGPGAAKRSTPSRTHETIEISARQRSAARIAPVSSTPRAGAIGHGQQLRAPGSRASPPDRAGSAPGCVVVSPPRTTVAHRAPAPQVVHARPRLRVVPL